MKERARLWGWIRHHWLWSSTMLIVLLVGMGCGLSWTINFIRFGLPPPTGQDCGSITHGDYFPAKNTRADATLQVLACFWHAYQSCQAATMSQTQAGTDVGYTDTVTIEQRDAHCAIYGQEEVGGNTKSNTTFLCNRLSKKGDTLQVSDCDGYGDLALVPRVIALYALDYESYVCGFVDSAHPSYGQPQQAESCFFTAYQQCLDDAMLYNTQERGTEVERGFIIDDHCGIAYLRRSYTAACASLELRADGLHFMQCGADGNIFVPSAPPGSLA